MAKAVKRIVLVGSLLAAASAFVRLRGRGGRPPSGSGWSEVAVGYVAEEAQP